jgi:hypothetical protein
MKRHVDGAHKCLNHHLTFSLTHVTNKFDIITGIKKIPFLQFD